MSSLIKVTMTKWPIQKPTHRTTDKHVEHHDATVIQKKLKAICIIHHDCWELLHIYVMYATSWVTTSLYMLLFDMTSLPVMESVIRVNVEITTQGIPISLTRIKTMYSYTQISALLSHVGKFFSTTTTVMKPHCQNVM